MKVKTSFFELFKRAIKMAISNIWRNKALSATTIFVIGIILFILNVILGINFIAQESLKELNKKIDIVVYIKESTQIEEINNIIRELEQLSPIESVEYTSKEAALKQIKTNHPNIPLAFEKYQLGNPLPASLNISTKSPEDHKIVAKILEEPQFKRYLSTIISNEQENPNPIISSVSKNLQSLSEFARNLIFWIITIFFIGGILIILNAIQITIYHRKQEIEIMKLVGASYWFIRLPFIIEGIIYAITAMIVSLIILNIVSSQISIEQTTLNTYINSLNFYKIFLAELIGAIALSVISAFTAVQEHLKSGPK